MIILNYYWPKLEGGSAHLLEKRIWIFLIVFIPSFTIPIIYFRFPIDKRQKSSDNKWFSMIWTQSSRFFMLNIRMFNLAKVGAIKPMTILECKNIMNVSYDMTHNLRVTSATGFDRETYPCLFAALVHKGITCTLNKFKWQCSYNIQFAIRDFFQLK